jgi:hypothetical protein
VPVGTPPVFLGCTHRLWVWQRHFCLFVPAGKYTAVCASYFLDRPKCIGSSSATADTGGWAKCLCTRHLRCWGRWNRAIGSHVITTAMAASAAAPPLVFFAAGVSVKMESPLAVLVSGVTNLLLAKRELFNRWSAFLRWSQSVPA